MALTPTQRIRQAQVEAVVSGAISHITQAQTLAIYNFPAQEVHVSQAQTLVVETADLEQKITQAQVLAIVQGRIDNRKVRAWTFSLDGHDFYVLRLGDSGTLVYDTATEQWAEWKTEDLPFWRLQTGMNWLGMSIASFNEGATAPIIAGDDTYGLLWSLVPEDGLDEDPRGPEYDDIPFTRKVTGGVVTRRRDPISCNAVYLTANVGYPQAGAADITLRTSDDNGVTWTDHGAITVEAANYTQEISWRSLGTFFAPGRIFELEDKGASVRLDNLDMYD